MPENGGTETSLQMTQRHVNEGKERITRQEALIARLDRERHDHMLVKVNGLLDEMQDFQANAETHLAREVAKGTGGKAGRGYLVTV